MLEKADAYFRIYTFNVYGMTRRSRAQRPVGVDEKYLRFQGSESGGIKQALGQQSDTT